MIKKSYKIKGMHCPSCAMLIEGDLEDIGVKAVCNYPQQSLEVEINDEEKEVAVKKVVKDLGYEIEAVKL